MEPLDSIRRFIGNMRHRQPEIPPRMLKAEVTDITDLWKYEYLREYLLSLARGSEFLLPSASFPKFIELSKDWYDLFDKLSAATADTTEHWGLIGFKSDKRTLMLSTEPTKGLPYRVKITQEYITRIQKELGIVGLIGDIHSHPSTPNNREEDIENFSAVDLYGLILESRVPYTRGLVSLRTNVLAFQSAETIPLLLDNSITTRNDFERHWHEQNGYRLNSPTEEGRQTITPVSSLSNMWSVNRAIADHFHLVIYKGEPGERLKRVFPE